MAERLASDFLSVESVGGAEAGRPLGDVGGGGGGGGDHLVTAEGKDLSRGVRLQVEEGR